MKKKSFTFYLTFLLLSCQNENCEHAIIDDFSINVPLVKDVSDLFDISERTIRLDTITEAMIGKVSKIVKHENDFYVLSDERRIVHFNNDGKCLSILDKRGIGPGEYTRIIDFDLYTDNGNTELWICDIKEIRKYVRSEKTWNEAGTINFDFVIHKFKIISNEHIIFVTGQNEESLLLTDIKGIPLQNYLKNEFSFLMLRAIQFINYKSCIIFQLGISNEGIELDTKDFSFKHINIIKNDRFLSSKELINIYDRYGIDYLGEVFKTNHIIGFRNISDFIWLEYKYQGNNFVALHQNGVWKRLKYDREKNFMMTSLIFSESCDSFILFEYPEDDNLNLILHEYRLF